MKIFSNIKEKLSAESGKLLSVLLLLACAVLIGAVCGVIGAAFAKSISFVTALRAENSWLVYLLPLGGLVSVGLYKLTKTDGIGTDRALESARGEEKTPVLLMPVIFAASVITHLFGGSAGKEGAALQLGSGVAELAAKITRADDKKRAVLTVCGMAALFSAVFGTPVAACVFAAEVAVIGSVNAAALVPAFASSVIAYLISTALGVAPERFHLHSVPDFGTAVLLKALAVAAIVAAVSAVFCYLLKRGKELSKKLIANPFIRIFAGGCVIIVLTLIFGTDYNGGGIFVIERIFEEGTVCHEAFLLKIIFTVITVSAGYKGGEIVPSLFIGATLGAVLSPIFGLTAEFGAALGMVAFFSGVTNCPLASAVIGVELFGTNGFILFAASAFAAKLFTGRISLYNKQKALLGDTP